MRGAASVLVSVEPPVGIEPTTCRLQGGCSWPAELSGQSVKMHVRSTRVRSVNVHRNVERKAGIEPATSTLATLCSATELHPQISERVRPSRFHVLQISLRSGLSPGTSHTARIECWTRMQASRLVDTSACVRRQGESPGNQIMLLNSVLAEQAAQGSIRAARTNPYRGLHLADGTLLGGFRRL
jgi:hypothetical protein